MVPRAAGWSFLVLAIAGAACASDDEPAGTAANTTAIAAPDTTAAPATTATPTTDAPDTTAAPVSVAPTTTDTTLPVPDALQRYRLPVSDEWVVETVVPELDSGTGGLAIDPTGAMYVGDFGQPDKPGTVVRRIGPDGTVETFATDEGMGSLTMTTFGPDGTLFQSSYGTDRVYAIDATGTPTLLTDEIRGPTGVAPLADGRLLIASYAVGTIYELQPDGTLDEWSKSPRYRGLNSLSQGPDGTIYAADHRDGQIFAVTPDGEPELLIEFPKPTSHVVYHDGSLFVTARTAYVVFRYDLATGDAEIIAGNGEAGDADGRGVAASFGSPNAITVGPDGALYINHGGGANNWPVTIRRIVHDPVA